MKTNRLDKNLPNVTLHLTVIISLLAVFSVLTFLPVQAAEKSEDELVIVQIIHEGPHETVLIVNLTREKIDLCDYLLKADKAGISFDFAEEADCKATIAPLSALRVHSGSGSSKYYASWNDIPWSQEEVWDDDSDKATLIDPDGNVVSSFSYGSDYE